MITIQEIREAIDIKVGNNEKICDLRERWRTKEKFDLPRTCNYEETVCELKNFMFCLGLGNVNFTKINKALGDNADRIYINFILNGIEEGHKAPFDIPGWQSLAVRIASNTHIPHGSGPLPTGE